MEVISNRKSSLKAASAGRNADIPHPESTDEFESQKDEDVDDCSLNIGEEVQHPDEKDDN